MFVYLISCQQYTKIGRAGNVDQRFWNLQTANPHELTLHRSWLSLDAKALESKLHGIFTAHRVKGEWFLLSNEQLTWLLSLPNDIDYLIEL